jgi:hypothetical protein
MFLKKFIKRQFISFYCDENYKLLTQIYRNNKLLEENRFEFKEKKELVKKIKELSIEIPQTYISTIIQSINQGVIPSCQKKDFKTYKIEINNIQYICIDNKYAFYTSLFDLTDLKKLNIDFIYSVFALIDYKATKKINTIYVLITKEKFYLLIYNKNIPIFSDIYENEEELIKENNDINIEELEDESVIEDIEDIDDDIVNDLDNIDDHKIIIEDDEIKTGIEINIINFIKSSLKEYYKNYADDFIENIVILDTKILNKDIINMIKETLFIEAAIEQIDILETINKISRKNV